MVIKITTQLERESLLRFKLNLAVFFYLKTQQEEEEEVKLFCNFVKKGFERKDAKKQQQQ